MLFTSFLSYKFFVTFVLFIMDINLNILLKDIFSIAFFSCFSIFILYFCKNPNNISKIYFLLIISQADISNIFDNVEKELEKVFGSFVET